MAVSKSGKTFCSNIDKLPLFDSNLSVPNENVSILESNITIESSSVVVVLYCKYRICISLDFTPSMCLVDASGRIPIEDLLDTLEKSLTELLQPIYISDLQFSPEIYITINIQGSITEAYQVLVQGMLLTFDNLSYIIKLLRTNVQEFETGAYDSYNKS